MEDPIITTQPVQPVLVAHPVSTPAHKKRWILIGSIALVVVVVGVVIWLILRKHALENPTPTQSLQQLQESSHPVYIPVENRAANLTKLSKSSAVPQTTQSRLDMLNSLKK